MPKINVRNFDIKGAIEFNSTVEEECGPIIDEGPWKVSKWRPRGDSEAPIIVIESDDFHYDAALEVSGDFGTLERKIEYAQYICDILNKRQK